VTTLAEINELVKRLSRVRAAVTWVLFNGIHPRPNYGYSKYRYAGYAYEQYTKKQIGYAIAVIHMNNRASLNMGLIA